MTVKPGKKVVVIFECRECPEQERLEVDQGEYADAYPNVLVVCGEGGVEFVLCPKHEREWMERIRKDDPDGVWLA